MKRTTALFIACALLLCGCSKAEDTPEYITTPAETSSETAPVPSEAEESPYKSYAFDHLTETEQQIYTAIADAAKTTRKRRFFPNPSAGRYAERRILPFSAWKRIFSG